MSISSVLLASARSLGQAVRGGKLASRPPFTCRSSTQRHADAIRRQHSTSGPQPAVHIGDKSPLARSQASLLPIVHHEAYSAPVLLELPDDDTLRLVHDDAYLQAFNTGTLDAARIRRIGIPADVMASAALITRTKAEVAGTLLTARLALERGLACNTAGGTHHAFPDFGSGFCILHDMAVTARLLLEEGAVTRVMIVDLDVHQGDGTAFIFRDDHCVFTLSVHAESNFPARKQSSDLDVPLPDGLTDAPYLQAVEAALLPALQDFQPDLVLYDAGVDVHADDDLGRLLITDEGMLQRDLLVLDTCVGMGIAVAGLVGGGYASDLGVLADRHICMHRAAQAVWQKHGLP